MSYAPYDYHTINMAQAKGQPNQVYMNSAIYDFWFRSLFQRMTSIFEWKVPDTWSGKKKDFMNWLLFHVGYVGIINGGEEYGVIFQPCTLGPGRNIFYQPSEFIVVNPYDEKLNDTYEIGKNGQLLSISPDYRGVLDTVEFYASRLALLYSSINTSLIMCRNPRILGAHSRAGAQALKFVADKVLCGDPFCILDSKILYPDAKTKDEAIFDLSPNNGRNEYYTDLLLESEKEILKEFDNTVGITNIDSKKERLVTAEAEVQKVNSSASAFVWFDCLKDSIKNIKEMFPSITLDVELRFGAEGMTENTEGGEDDVPGSDNIIRN